MIRLHLPAIPHTITKDEYSHCAFTGKVQRFSPMMRSVGFEVYHYGVETSESGANEQINLVTVEEWNILRKDSLKFLFPDITDEDIDCRLFNPTKFVGDLGNVQTPLYKEFNNRFREQLIKNYRSKATDIVCIPFGLAYYDALNGLDVASIETGIGYVGAYLDFRIYESYAIMHHDYFKCGGIQNYWFVCPNYYNCLEWPLQLNPNPSKIIEGHTKPIIGFLGRIGDIKGIYIIIEIARIFKDITYTLCGQGDPSTYLIEPNIVYIAPIHGKKRGEYMSNLTALLAPSMFLEPFCGVSAEAQLCGTPVISSDYGAFSENIEPFKTGIRCHTLSDYIYGVKLALEGKFDRQYIHNRAVELFDMYNVAKKYKYVFGAFNDIHNGTNGWYSSNSNIEAIDPNKEI